LVSVIVPTRDRPDLLANAIRSALGQSYDTIEICIVDDGSDPPVTLAPDLAADERVHLTRVESSIGPAAARNLAIEQSRGELLAFLDDDDEWLPDKTARQVASLTADVAGVQCGWEFHDDLGLVFTFVPDLERDLPRLLLERPAMAPSSVLLRRSAFDTAGGFDPSLRRMEDWDLWLRVADRYCLSLVPDVLVRRRGHPGRIVAAEELPAFEVMIERLRPRLAALPDEDRRRLQTLHAVHRAELQARARQRRRAVATLLHAWRRAPSSRAIYRALFVTLVVETPAWRLLRHLRLRRRRPAAHPPAVRSW
jgi:glycosyltransferase involved in cell wall biosynthesis